MNAVFFFVSELRITRGPANAIVLLNKPHDFRCDTTFSDVTSQADSDVTVTQGNDAANVTSPSPQQPAQPVRHVAVIWQKDGETIRRAGDNYRVRRKSGTLHFYHVRYSDRGRYRCIVQNEAVKIHSSYAELTVHGKFQLTSI